LDVALFVASKAKRCGSESVDLWRQKTHHAKMTFGIFGAEMQFLNLIINFLLFLLHQFQLNCQLSLLILSIH
jgi:hypothetical protein